MEIDLDTIRELDNYFCKTNDNNAMCIENVSTHSTNVFVEQKTNLKNGYISENLLTTSCVDDNNKYHCNSCKIFLDTDLCLKNHIRDKHSDEFEAEKNETKEYSENQQEIRFPIKLEVDENISNYNSESQQEFIFTGKFDVDENVTNCDIEKCSENQEEHSFLDELGENNINCNIKEEYSENIIVDKYVDSEYVGSTSPKIEEENPENLIVDKDFYSEYVEGLKAKVSARRAEKQHQRNNLIQYIDAQHSEPQFECDLCEHRFSQKRSLRMHIISKHLTTKKKNTCQGNFKREKISKNYRKYARRKLLFCQYCNKKLFSEISLKLHEDKHRGVTYACDQCSKSFTDITSLYRHRKTAHYGFVYKCKICGLKLADDRTLLRHEKNVHNKLGIDDTIRFQCHLCDASYIRKDSLRVHIKLHYMSKNDVEKWSKNRSQPSFCEECKHFLENKSCLKQHQKYFHMKIVKGEDEEEMKNDHKCFICNEMLSSKFDLINHLSCKHENMVKWQCEFCDQIYKSRVQLKKHRLTHKVVQYNCIFCENTFFEKELLNLHIHSSHSEEIKKNECWKCKIKFKSKLCLDKHMSGEHCPNQFICLDCNVTYESLDEMQWHVKTWHHLLEQSDQEES